MLRQVHGESPRLSRHAFSHKQATHTVYGLLAHKASFMGVAYLNGELIGGMGGIISPELTSDALVATELLLYVYPQYRGSRAALMLVRAFEEWAKPYDMQAGSSLGIDDRKAISFYEHLGFQRIGVSLSKLGTQNV